LDKESNEWILKVAREEVEKESLPHTVTMKVNWPEESGDEEVTLEWERKDVSISLNPDHRTNQRLTQTNTGLWLLH